MLRIVVVNDRFRRRSGTEIVTRDIAFGLRARGLDVAVFTEKTGPIADEVREAGAFVTTSARSLPWRPDVVHANHPDVAAPLFALFPEIPAIAVCHDPHRAFCVRAYPNIVHIFGVSNECRKRAAADLGIPLANVGLLPNAIDTSRIRQRGKLPDHPRRWLFVAEKKGSRELLPIIKRAAAKFGAEVEVVGPRAPITVPDLPAHAATFDLVIASARSALECCAAGVAVCVADPRGVAGLLTRDAWTKWKDANLGWGVLSKRFDDEELIRAIRRYDPREAEATCAIVRAEASQDRSLDRLVQIYRETRDEPVSRHQFPFPSPESRSWLRRLIGA